MSDEPLIELQGPPGRICVRMSQAERYLSKGYMVLGEDMPPPPPAPPSTPPPPPPPPPPPEPEEEEVGIDDDEDVLDDEPELDEE